MTREEKIRAILLVAEGKKSPGRADETIFWCEWEKGIYKGVINGKEIQLNEQRFEYCKNKLGGLHLVFRFADVVEQEPEPMPVISPEIIPEPITEDTEAEIVAEPGTTNETVTITPAPEPKYKDIPFEELDWIDSPISERINFMFPRWY